VNGIGCVLANREDEKEALPYLQEGERMYNDVMEACKTNNKDSLFEGLKLSPLDLFLLQRDEKADEDTKIVPVIMRSFELNYIEASFTQTLFYLA
jgi:hypothetical protein